MLTSGELANNIKKWGAGVVGFSDVGHKLPSGLKLLKCAVTIIIPLSDFIIEQITDRPTYTYFHHYRTVNALIDQISLKATMLLEQHGFNALAVPASQSVSEAGQEYCGLFPHKTAAVMAGLGWLGRSNLFISTAYGPRVRLGTILTDMELPAHNSIIEGKCERCRICVSACPAMALTGNDWFEGCDRSHIFDAKACSEYMNRNFKHIGRGSVCGICIKVCPFRKAVK